MRNKFKHRSSAEQAAIIAEINERLQPKAHRRSDVRDDGMIQELDDLSPGLLEEIRKKAKSLGVGIEEAVVRILREGLQPEETKTPTTTSESAVNRSKASTPIAPLPPEEIMNLSAKIAGLLAQGRISEAKDLEKIVRAHRKHEAKLTPEQERQNLIESIVRNGNSLLR